MSNNFDLRNIRVAGANIGTTGGESKSLAEFLQNLPKGGVLSGFILQTDKAKKSAIFYTPYGRFSAPNDLNLNKGDRFTIKLNNEGEKINGNIVSVNDKEVGNRKISLVFIDNNKAASRSVKLSESQAVAFSDNLKHIGQQKLINGTIQYLNLSKMQPSSFLYSQLAALNTTNPNITLQLVTKKELSHQLIIDGEVIKDKNDGHLIKTIFGIIKPQDTSLPFGLKTRFKIKSFAGQDYDFFINSILTKLMGNKPYSGGKITKELKQSYQQIKALLGQPVLAEEQDISSILGQQISPENNHEKLKAFLQTNKQTQERVFSLEFENSVYGQVKLVGNIRFADKQLQDLQEFSLRLILEEGAKGLDKDLTQQLKQEFYDSMGHIGLQGNIEIT